MRIAMGPTLIVTALSCASEPQPRAACEALPPALPGASGTLQVADREYVLYSAGPDQGQVVLLLQGFPDRAFEYRTLLPRLAGAGYRALAPLRSGPPSAAATQAGTASEVLAIADALQLPRFHLAGGQLAWDVAKQAPERVLSVATTSALQSAAVAQLERIAAECEAAAAGGP
jgi:pimeloyl-ACP methyl ester carboxylesterase